MYADIVPSPRFHLLALMCAFGPSRAVCFRWAAAVQGVLGLAGGGAAAAAASNLDPAVGPAAQLSAEARGRGRHGPARRGPRLVRACQLSPHCK